MKYSTSDGHCDVVCRKCLQVEFLDLGMWLGEVGGRIVCSRFVRGRFQEIISHCNSCIHKSYKPQIAHHSPSGQLWKHISFKIWGLISLWFGIWFPTCLCFNCDIIYWCKKSWQLWCFEVAPKEQVWCVCVTAIFSLTRKPCWGWNMFKTTRYCLIIKVLKRTRAT